MNERLINKDSDNINGKLLTEKQNEINNLQYEILDLKGKLEEFQYKILLADRDYRQGKVDIDELKRKNKLDLESYEDKISNSFSDGNNKIFDEPSSNDEGISIKNLETVSYIFINYN